MWKGGGGGGGGGGGTGGGVSAWTAVHSGVPQWFKSGAATFPHFYT